MLTFHDSTRYDRCRKKFVSVSAFILIQECKNTIEKYKTDSLLSKKVNFSNMGLYEQEKFIMGLIKLGEAFTFCRNSNSELLIQ